MERTNEKLARAKAHERAREWAAAEQLYREILAADPENATVLYFLGALYQAGERLDEALPVLERAALLNSRHAPTHDLLGIVLAKLGRLDAAEDHFREALRLKPGAVEVAKKLQTVQAVKAYQQGLVLAREQRLDEAVACCRRAVEIKPDYFEAHNGLAGILADQGKLGESVACYTRAVQLHPGYTEAYLNLSTVLAALERLVEATQCCRRALELSPNLAEAHNNLGGLLGKQQRLDEAIVSYRRAIELKPGYGDAHYNLGITLGEQDRPDEAAQCYRQVLAIRPDHVQSLYFLATALMEQNEIDAAAECYRRIFELRPDHADAHIGRASGLLLTGQLTEGWREYEWRLQLLRRDHPALTRPAWTGAPLEGRTILLLSEQGSGDTLQFLRYAELVKQRGGVVIVECSPALKRLVASATGVDAVVVRGEPWLEFDVQAQLLSLPGIFGTTLENIPAREAYLAPAAAAVARWKDELSADTAFKIGIAWQGDPRMPRDRIRSIPLAHFADLAALPGVRLYSLQFGHGREQLEAVGDRWQIVDFGERLGDFDSTAALVRNLDLVITCDSSPAHVAGAIGAPVWVALPFAPDWRWLLNREDSPWYPTMRLFRQTRRGDWAGVFARIKAALVRLMEERR